MLARRGTSISTMKCVCVAAGRRRRAGGWDSHLRTATGLTLTSNTLAAPLAWFGSRESNRGSSICCAPRRAWAALGGERRGESRCRGDVSGRPHLEGEADAVAPQVNVCVTREKYESNDDRPSREERASLGPGAPRPEFSLLNDTGYIHSSRVGPRPHKGHAEPLAELGQVAADGK